MRAYQLRSVWLGLLAAGLLAACAVQPGLVQEEPLAATASRVCAVQPGLVQEEPLAATASRVDETAMPALLGYLQRLQHMSAQKLVRERSTLAAMAQTPEVHVRLAMLLGQARAPTDIIRAQALLDGVLKSGDPAAVKLHPVARFLANQYSERLKLEMQNEKLVQQLKESQRRNVEFQEKLEALADIERSLPVRPTVGENPPGAPR